MIRLKTAELFHTRELTLLATECFPNLSYDDLYRELHAMIKDYEEDEGNGLIYTAVRNDIIIAFAQCKLIDDAAILRRLCVTEEYKNKRIDKRLIKEFEQWAKKNNHDKLIYMDGVDHRLTTAGGEKHPKIT